MAAKHLPNFEGATDSDMGLESNFSKTTTSRTFLFEVRLQNLCCIGVYKVYFDSDINF